MPALPGPGGPFPAPPKGARRIPMPSAKAIGGAALQALAMTDLDALDRALGRTSERLSRSRSWDDIAAQARRTLWRSWGGLLASLSVAAGLLTASLPRADDPIFEPVCGGLGPGHGSP